MSVLLNQDCIKAMREMREGSVDSIVTDPPYGLNFMGKEWDRLGDRSANYTNLDRPHESQKNFAMTKTRGRPISETDGPAQQLWHEQWAREAFRVLKPGGFLLGFGGSRTYHRMACAIEDAGFEIRDQIMWIYGSGFPKSLDVSKAIDKSAGAKREVVGTGRRCIGPSQAGLNGIGTFKETNWMDSNLLTVPATDAAKQWEGWGTALKPAHEPIVVARKPLAASTVAENVLEFGTGAMNIDGCRIPTNDPLGGGAESQTRADQKSNEGWTRPWMSDEAAQASHAERVRVNVKNAEALGRWPANVIHDGSDEVLEEFEKYGVKKSCMSGSKADSEGTIFGGSRTQGNLPMDTGTAARFFYCAKTSKSGRGEGNDHPTVKPLALMRYLVRLVTPPNGVVLDPFMGSGSTGLAAEQEGFGFIGIEQNEHYYSIASGRMGIAA